MIKKFFSFVILLAFFSLLFFSNANNVIASGVSLSNPLGSNTTIQGVVGRVINAILGVVGSLTLLMFVYGGITWMTSSGAPEKVKKGRDIILWSIIGLAVIFFSYAMVNFVLFDVINPSTGTSAGVAPEIQ